MTVVKRAKRGAWHASACITAFGAASHSVDSHFANSRATEFQYAVIKFIPAMEIEFVRVYLFTGNGCSLWEFSATKDSTGMGADLGASTFTHVNRGDERDPKFNA